MSENLHKIGKRMKNMIERDIKLIVNVIHFARYDETFNAINISMITGLHVFYKNIASEQSGHTASNQHSISPPDSSMNLKLIGTRTCT